MLLNLGAKKLLLLLQVIVVFTPDLVENIVFCLDCEIIFFEQTFA